MSDNKIKLRAEGASGVGKTLLLDFITRSLAGMYQVETTGEHEITLVPCMSSNAIIPPGKYLRCEAASTLQPWVHVLPRMQQAVILGAMRGPDGVAKDHPSKYAVRYMRRSVLVTAFTGEIILDLHTPGGGDYTGPVPDGVDPTKAFLKVIDTLPYHFVTHFVQAAHVIATCHPSNDVKWFWYDFYKQWCDKAHVRPEGDEEMRERLSDNEERWRARK